MDQWDTVDLPPPSLEIKEKRKSGQTPSPGPPRPTAEPSALKVMGLCLPITGCGSYEKMEAGFSASCSPYRGGLTDQLRPDGC